MPSRVSSVAIRWSSPMNGPHTPAGWDSLSGTLSSDPTP